MTFHVREGGAWKEITDPQVRDGGSWKEIIEGYVRDAGSWKKFYARITVFLPGGTAQRVVPQGNTATATVGVHRSGLLELINGSNYDWHTAKHSTVGDGFEVFAEHISGTQPAGSYGAWLALSANQFWNLSRSAIGTSSGVIRLTVRETTNHANTGTGDFTLTAQVESSS